MSLQSAYTCKHVETLYSISPSTRRRAEKSGRLPFTRLYPGGPKRYLPEHLQTFEEHMRRDTEQAGIKKLRRSDAGA